MGKICINGITRDMTVEEQTQFDNQQSSYNPFNDKMEELRAVRNARLTETDFYALSDVTMSEDMTTYRQALRDLPSGLSTVEEVQAVTYPTKP